MEKLMKRFEEMEIDLTVKVEKMKEEIKTFTKDIMVQATKTIALKFTEAQNQIQNWNDSFFISMQEQIVDLTKLSLQTQHSPNQPARTLVLPDPPVQSLLGSPFLTQPSLVPQAKDREKFKGRKHPWAIISLIL